MRNTFWKTVGTAAMAILMMAVTDQFRVSAQDTAVKEDGDKQVSNDFGNTRNHPDITMDFRRIIDLSLGGVKTGHIIPDLKSAVPSFKNSFKDSRAINIALVSFKRVHS